ncbi:hypothetical protein MGMO_112c00110 [Methyloglobulus morosus KoM1]|uniref:Uncharacterized protein n=1 Tax=Methyloglobulus morosus KoM1 TaxID=1116472 RepID=V5BYE9_9GAMM|nr:hypothetical protein [Methyloglobulus morosus]ESS71272.1 hypothetical protein MGMO_112c00110 [Methyloglobulus morosus KoM1]
MSKTDGANDTLIAAQIVGMETSGLNEEAEFHNSDPDFCTSYHLG